MESDGPVTLPLHAGPPKKAALVLLVALAIVYNLGLIFLVAVVTGASSGGDTEEVRGLFELGPRYGIALLILLVFLDVGIVSSAIRRYRFRKGAGPAIFWPDRFEVPDASGHVRHVLPYADVLLVQLGRRFVFIDAKHRLIKVPRGAFHSLADLESFLRRIHAGIAKLPGGSERLAAMARRLMLAESAYQRPIISSFRLVLLFALIYLVQRTLDASFNQADIALGANVAALTRDGQLFRIVSANFLHANLVHLGVNGFALVSLGSVLERLLGRDRFVVLFLGSCIFGAMASTLLAGHAIGLGSSTGVAGLLGGLLYLALRYREKLPTEFRQPWSLWFTLFAMNAWIALLVPNIDHVAHGGGFLAGILLTAGLCPHNDPIDLLEKPISLLLRLGSRGLVGFIAAVFAIGVGSRWPESAQDTKKTWAAWAESATAEELNFMAWTQVAERPPETAPSWLPIQFLSPAEELALGLELAQRANKLSPEDAQIRDTLATIHYRRGELDEAIRLGRRFDLPKLEDFRASQLARFELDRRAVLGGPVVSSTVALPSVELESGSVVLRFSAPLAVRVELHLIVHREEEPLGFFELRVGPTDELEFRLECPSQICAPEGAPPAVSVGLFESGHLPPEEHGVVARASPYLPDVAKLPRFRARGTEPP